MRLTVPSPFSTGTIQVSLCDATVRRLEQILWLSDHQRQASALAELLKKDPACAFYLAVDLLPCLEQPALDLTALAELAAGRLAQLLSLQLSAAPDEISHPAAEKLGPAAARSALLATLVGKLAVRHQCPSPESFELAALLLGAAPLINYSDETNESPTPADLSSQISAWLTDDCGLPDVAAFHSVAEALLDARQQSPDHQREAEQPPEKQTKNSASAPLSPKLDLPASEELFSNAEKFLSAVERHWQQADPAAFADLSRLAHRLAPLEALQHEFAARLEAEKLLAMKELAYGAGHEINNPLANISVRAQTLIKQETDPERKRMLAAINGQVYRAHEMIADLMLFAQPPAMNPEPTELGELLRRCVHELRPEAARQDSQLLLLPQEKPLEAEVDPLQIALALHAMVMNSLEAIGRGGTITLSATRRLAPRGEQQVEIAIEDDGPGISEEVRRHLFDPFYSGREAGRGLGFGLSKCWRIVTAHGGRIEVRGNPGQGACFKLFLPVHPRSVENAAMESVTTRKISLS